MTPEDKYALREILQGAGIVVGCFSAFILVMIVLAQITTNGEPLKSSFEVVDQYKGCDVVRYAPHQAAEYKYFLHCENK